MPVDGSSPFPRCIEDPGALRGGSVYVADLAVEGPRIGDRPFDRAVCTLARECTDDSLAFVELPDDRTAFVLTEDDTRTQLALVYGRASLSDGDLAALSECRRADIDRVVVAMSESVTADAHGYCLDRNNARQYERIHSIGLVTRIIWNKKSRFFGPYWT